MRVLYPCSGPSLTLLGPKVGQYTVKRRRRPAVTPTIMLESVEYGCKPRRRGVWSALGYAPVFPMDHDPLGLASRAENADVEPVEHTGSTHAKEKEHCQL